MCGITGLISINNLNSLSNDIQLMSNTLSHRGPDFNGVWVDKENCIALGHSRLSIIDLSSAGVQPMISTKGRYVITFNGEIYNHQELRKRLNGNWIGNSDTETLLSAFETWGIEATLPQLEGMFALGLWDTKEKVLYLARDRFGEKPLYFGWAKNSFLFSSELKAIKAFPGFSGTICPKALAQFIRFLYVPTPLSIYKGIFKLEPGCLLKLQVPFSFDIHENAISIDDSFSNIQLTKWWSLSKLVISSKLKLIRNEKIAINELELRLREAINIQSLSDVPLGAFLSGGIDSSTIVALMQSQSDSKIKTFTIGFDESEYDESKYAKNVANYLGTDHYEVMVTAKDALDIIPKLPYIYDEPFADSSQIPSIIVSREAKKNVTVVLSGDGGDEIFGGYNRYNWAKRIWDNLSYLPFPMRQRIGRLLFLIPMDKWSYFPDIFGISMLGDKVWKLANRLNYVNDGDELYNSLVAQDIKPNFFMNNNFANNMTMQFHPIIERSKIPLGLLLEERMMYMDSLTYLSDDILCKMDRASMFTSLETRSPFLDSRIVELSWRLPLNMKIRGNVSKWVLREVLKKYVPSQLTERPKAGFAIPIGKWLRGPLKYWAEELISEHQIKRSGQFNLISINNLWSEHQSLKRDHTNQLWAILMFQAWYKENL